MTILSKLDRKTFFISSVCVAVGFGIGVFFEQWLLWYRQVGRFNEILRRLSILEDELLQVKVKLKQPRTPLTSQTDCKIIIPTGSKALTTPRREDESSGDEYVDFDSETDEFLSVSSGQISQNASMKDKNFYDQIDYLLDGSYAEKRIAYQTLRDKRLDFSEEGEFLWRWAKSAHTIYEELGGTASDEGKQFLYEAQALIEKALRLGSLNPSVHKWFAVIIGSVGECQSITEKIKNGYRFKEHIDRAIQLDELDAEAHYLNGRFCYHVSQLSWMERQLASTLFATPPTATIDEALHAFLRCERIEQDRRIRNHYYTALCYLVKDDMPKVLWWLESAERIETRDEADRAYLSDVAQLLEKHRF